MFRAAELGAARSGVLDGFYFALHPGAAVDVVFDSYPSVKLSLAGSTRVSFSTDRPTLLSVPANTPHPVNLRITAVSGVSGSSPPQYIVSDCASRARNEPLNLSGSTATVAPLRCSNSSVILVQNLDGARGYSTSVVDVTIEIPAYPLRFSYSASSPTSNLFSFNVSPSFSAQPTVTIEIPTADPTATIEFSSPQAAETLFFTLREKCCSDETYGSITNSTGLMQKFTSNSRTISVLFETPTQPGNTTVFVKVKYGSDFCTPGVSIADCDGIIDFPYGVYGDDATSPTKTLRTLDTLFPDVSSTCRDTIRRFSCLTVATICTPGQAASLCKQQCLSELQSVCPSLPFGFRKEACLYSPDCMAASAQPAATSSSALIPPSVCAAPALPPVEDAAPPTKTSSTSARSTNLLLSIGATFSLLALFQETQRRIR